MSQYNPNPTHLHLIEDLVPNPLPEIPSRCSHLHLRYYGPSARAFCEAFRASLVSHEFGGQCGRSIRVKVASEKMCGPDYGDTEVWVADEVTNHLMHRLWMLDHPRYHSDLVRSVVYCSLGYSRVNLSNSGHSVIVTCYLRRIGNRDWQRAKIYIQPYGGLVEIMS